MRPSRPSYWPLLAGPASAQAVPDGTVQIIGLELRVIAGPGTANDITTDPVPVDRNQRFEYRVTDLSRRLAPVAPCERAPGGLSIDCPVVNGDGGLDPAVTVEVGDGADRVTVRVLRPATVRGGPGNDTINGPDSRSTLDGGPGDDTIQGGTSIGTILGGDGNDTITDRAPAPPPGVHPPTPGDNLDGGNGDDRITAGGRDQYVTGGPGNDRISGGADRDGLWGGPGSDYFDADPDGDLISGQDGIDTVSYVTRRTAIRVDLASPQARQGGVEDGQNGDRIEGVERAQAGQGNDVLLGGPGDNLLYASGGNDTVDGRGGNDRIAGGMGRDTLLGGPGNDDLQDADLGLDAVHDCGPGIDVAHIDPFERHIVRNCETVGG